MVTRDYLVRQVATLLRMSKAARDPQVSAGLAVKAADMKSQLDDGSVVKGSPTAKNTDVPKT
jgi:hypothetical protein